MMASFNTVLVDLRDLVGQPNREDDAYGRRGSQAGRVKQDLSGSSQTHGYAVIAGKSGERVIFEAETEGARAHLPSVSR
jgi:hypothetical protein